MDVFLYGQGVGGADFGSFAFPQNHLWLAQIIRHPLEYMTGAQGCHTIRFGHMVTPVQGDKAALIVLMLKPLISCALHQRHPHLQVTPDIINLPSVALNSWYA